MQLGIGFPDSSAKLCLKNLKTKAKVLPLMLLGFDQREEWTTWWRVRVVMKGLWCVLGEGTSRQT
jgi:hypothetical protein